MFFIVIILLLENPPFADFFNNKIKRLTSVLYTLQHQEKQKPFTNPEEFVRIFEARDPELRGFLMFYINQQILLQKINLHNSIYEQKLCLYATKWPLYVINK